MLRRSYIPPIMDMFQDVMICTKYVHPKKGEKDENDEEEDFEEKVCKEAYKFLNETHRAIIDSIYPNDTGSNSCIYEQIIKDRARSLLMDEDTMTFYTYNLNITPNNGISLAFNYML